MTLLNKTWKNLMTVGITAGICVVGAQTPEEAPHVPEPERQLETPAEIKKNSLAEEDARNQDLPKIPWKSSGKIAVKGSTSSANMDTGLESKGGAFVEREPDEQFPVKIKVGYRVSSGRHTLGHKISGSRDDHRLTRFGFKGNSFIGGVVIPFSKNPEGPYLFLGRFDGYVGYDNCDDNKGWFLSGLSDNEFPGNHTGGFISYPINKQIKVNGYLVAGWNETINDKNKKLSGGLSVRYAPNKKLAVGIAYYGGKEGENAKPGEDTKDKTYGKIQFQKPGITRVDLGSAYVQYEVDDKWTYAVEGFYGRAKEPNASKWYGGGIFVYHQYDKQWQIGGSLETTKEEGGFLTKKPLPQTRANSIAIVAKTSTTKNSNLKAELRYSWANQPLFDNGKKKSRVDLNLVQTYNF